MNTTIIILFAILAVLSVWHFVWEAIIAPSARLAIRFQLFALRDRLRCIKEEQPHSLDCSLFESMNSAMNDLIDRLPFINIGAIATTGRTLENDPEVAKHVALRETQLEKCEIAEVRAIDRSCQKLFMNVFFVNSGGWLIYLVPIAVCLSLYGRIASAIQSLIYSEKAYRDAMLPSPGHTQAHAA